MYLGAANINSDKHNHIIPVVVGEREYTTYACEPPTQPVQ